ncbi:trypsin-like serine protease [Pelagibius sp. 7325]|uniref:trypsin-like serine peptidase n=1 Tax=Pelagibius sp. 7325 TaxID=3131994 RepID=UPI0030EF7066
MRQCPERTTASALKLAAGAGLLLLLQACGTPQSLRETAPVTPAASAPEARPSLAGRMTVDAQEYPWSALGRVNLAGQGFCTGILIGPAQVLTQARCLYAGREGRWFRPQELHFIAAYQKDSYLADSKIAEFTVAPGFNPQGGVSLANLTNNWAVVTLQQPIGHETGWLGLQWDNSDLQAAARRGRAAYLRAGYRSDWPHAVSLHFGCAERAGTVALCEATPTERSLPSFVAAGGELRVLADFFVATPDQGRALATLAAQPISDNRLGGTKLPAAGGTIGRQPTATVSQLLEALGYDVTGGDIAAAADAFRRDNGLPRGTSDIALMTALLHAVQHQLR